MDWRLGWESVAPRPGPATPSPGKCRGRPAGDDDPLWPEDEDPEDLDPVDPGDEEPGGEGSAGDLAAVDALLARTRRSLAAFNQPGPGDAPLRLRDPDYGGAERLAAWLAVLERGQDAPAILAAALALDAWLLLEPAERGGELGFAMAAAVLRQRGLAAHHLPALGLGYRKGRFRWGPHQALPVRIAGLVDAISESVRLADADLKRLGLAREVMLRRCEGRRGNSKLPQLVAPVHRRAAGHHRARSAQARRHAAGRRSHAQGAGA